MQSGSTLTSTLAAAKSRDMIRLRCRYSGEYLHLSGHGTTRGTTYAWLGTRAQARTLRDAAAEAGREWPFRGEQRTLT